MAARDRGRPPRRLPGLDRRPAGRPAAKATAPPAYGRVKAYRKLARDGALPPLLLWWISGLDGVLLLDGRAQLERDARAGRPAVDNAARAHQWRFGALYADLPAQREGSRAWPLPGGSDAWDRARLGGRAAERSLD
ncbi:hypothetical protein [Actinoallomurus iriomotensis]|uniref:hypothetical protein n=1 Tax=Actinoallomurus iriomotensis TaxID=478107 RepID=UPI002553FE68|nr:hypothetical protein [Actinoallomurus iriomotensis]